MVPKNSTPGGFAYIWQSKWVGIIAIKTERTQIHFLSDVLIAVASLDLKVPIVVIELRLLYSGHLVIIGAVEAHIVTPVVYSSVN